MVGKKIGISPLMFQLKVSRTEAFRIGYSGCLSGLKALESGAHWKPDMQPSLAGWSKHCLTLPTERVHDRLSSIIGDFSKIKDTRSRSSSTLNAEVAQSLQKTELIKEEVRECVLRESLSRKDRQSRQVMAWTNRDKLSTAWLQGLPGPDGFLNPEMSEF